MRFDTDSSWPITLHYVNMIIRFMFLSNIYRMDSSVVRVDNVLHNL